MASEPHTYGPTCSLHVETNPFTRRASMVSEIAPKLNAHFFYNSALPIDDPLSPVPPPTASTSSAALNVPPRPFSVYDNAALEEAWQGLQDPGSKATKREKMWKGESADPDVRETGGEGGLGENSITQEPKLDHIVNIIKSTKSSKIVKSDKTASTGVGREMEKSKLSTVQAASTPPAAGSESPSLDSPKLVAAEPEIHSPHHKEHRDPHVLLCDNPDHIPFDFTAPSGPEEIDIAELESGTPEKKHRTPFHRRRNSRKEKPEELTAMSDSSSRKTPERRKIRVPDFQYGSSPSERDTTGTPFLRAPDPEERVPYSDGASDQSDGADMVSDDEKDQQSSPRPLSQQVLLDLSDSYNLESEDHARPSSSNYGFSFRRKERKAYVPVGLSRLHLVEMPELQMKPIYWSPVHDISSVIRGTWFYKDTMLPVEPDVANRLEEGYEYMKPWTQTYVDEMDSCMEIGPEAELKIVHRLWPSEVPINPDSRPATGKSNVTSLKGKAEQLDADKQAFKEAVKIAASVENKAVGALEGKVQQVESIRLYARSSVIYANARDAQILKPGQLPSVAMGRRPLGPIRKGRPIGVPVVRGFDHKAWEKIHPSKKGKVAVKALVGAVASQSGAAATLGQRDVCRACEAEENRPKATDLVLVIHGIGQKLSERVESFHFTHAINAFRRQMNVELESDAVQPWLRQDLGGIMVLPINWRSTLSLEEGALERTSNRKHKKSRSNDFTLKDITADTIPAVRNLISDVMLDIPYYLSHHKPKMIEAVIKEANRVYRLWCQNNPGFQLYGRVHLIAHSLGSVMALDILSKQPTTLPKQLDLKSRKVHNDMFEFDTKSLFFCGSPAGFFLLLNQAHLLPRKGRNKPGADGEDVGRGIAGEAGTFGCLAVDNVYNVMHYNDPIAYRVNACVDVRYADSLQPAAVPSATSTWLQSIGAVFRKPTIPLAGPTGLDTFPRRPTVVKLPSTIEMETHDFTQEEIAEKKMYLLNDNGQIDYFLSSGGGPLEIQYLNMLSAHSSYWILQDFVRFLVVEIGRKQGRGETVLSMRAVKKAWGKK